jgi:hypothetical protein
MIKYVSCVERLIHIWKVTGSNLVPAMVSLYYVLSGISPQVKGSKRRARYMEGALLSDVGKASHILEAPG